MKTKQHTLRIILLFAFFLAQTSSILAQTNTGKLMLKGTIADSASRNKLAFITIKLNNDKGETIRAGVTKEDGSFAFSSLAPATYHIVIVAIGYQPKIFSLDLQKDSDLGTVVLKQQSNSLKEVSVTATKPIIKQKADRIIYDLSADPESKSSSVLAMMHKIPYITLDGQDNILLKGNSSFKVLINGKPSASVESNLNAILKSMPASTIERIEVITIPPSKYDGEGLAGIINIITVKKVSNGYTGTLNANESFPVGGPGAGGSFTAKSGKFVISAFAGASIVNNPQTSFTNSRETFDAAPTSLLQTGERRANNKTAYFGTEMSYEIDSLHLISGQINLNGSRATDYMSQASQLNGSPVVTQAYDLLNNNKGTSYGGDAAINYQIGFKAVKNRLLTFSYQYSGNRNNRNGDVAITNPVNFNTPNYTQNDKQNFNEHTLQADFVTPIKHINIEAGVKGILRTSNSNFGYNSFNSTTGQFDLNTALSNQYTNKQNVFSTYNFYQINLKSWNINAGVRVEETVIRADFISTATTADQDYFNVLPSISVGKNLSDQTALNFGFSQRIRRPGINRLNPYINRSNPNFEVTGNPNLRPVLLNDIQAGYSSNKKLSLNIGLDYSFMNNLDLQVADFDPATQITRTTYENTGKSSSAGSNLSVSYPVSKVYNVSLNGNVMYLWLQGISDGVVVHNNMLMYSFSFSNGFRFDKGWAVNADLNIVSRNPTGLQGYSNGFFGTAFSANKELIKNKLGFAVRVNNPFTGYRNNVARTFGPDFNQLYNSRDYYRSFGISLNYKFGGLNDGVNKSRRSIENNDVAN
ncbi:outer membrane receptor protein involved in Fe transport [Mucilaginibacter gracilis]|uniref:Outer membrane receptor protein involved in Fe transport n=1 Tax=Mucilaginibacter gracilis TaxID=423350 RepID=A0A495ITL1_9SPHI|nr:TonB-dependent receptor [Mucilaginibacter gracilis]RKR80116.1 outer membrane receptor protein involved in Fe transport [Mucilaginibacter gracilis]